MNCKLHPGNEVVAICKNCGAGICSDCSKVSKDYDGLCPSCARKGLTIERASNVEWCSKHKKRAIVLSIMYVVGIILFLVGIFAFKGDWDGIIVFCGLGILLIGIYPAILGWKKGEEIHRKSERIFGETYTVSSSGVTKDTGLFEKVFSAGLHLLLGIVMTPVEIFSQCLQIKELQSDIVAIDKEQKRIDNIVSSSK